MANESALKQANEMITNLRNKISSGVKNFVTDLPANSAYMQAMVSKAVAPRFMLPEAGGNENYNNPNLDERNRYMRNELVIENLDNTPNKSMSAQLNEWPVAPETQYNTELEKNKQKILDSGIYRPAMAKYLSTIPVYGGYENPGGGFTQVTPHQTYTLPDGSPEMESYKNQSWETYEGPNQPAIEIGITPEQTNYDIQTPSIDPRTSSVMAHELVHASPRNQNDKQAFTDFFNKINAIENPILYNYGLTYLQNGQQPPNAEELYATLAQQMGQDVFKYPEIKNYFQNLYKQ
jgi:hypothetical protein